MIKDNTNDLEQSLLLEHPELKLIADPFVRFYTYRSKTEKEFSDRDRSNTAKNIYKKLNGKYKLISDIDCAGFNFKPIGGNTVFSGYFNGNGFKIKNLSITNRNFNLSCVGLFGILKGEDFLL